MLFQMLHNAIDMRLLMMNFGRYPPAPDGSIKWTERAYRQEINGK
jgi:hypothetical protein